MEVAPLLWTKLPPMLSQCLGSFLPDAKRRQTEEEDREKGMLGRPLSIRESYGAGKRRQGAASGVTDVTVNLKLTIISCFMSLQFITTSVSSSCSVIASLFLLFNKF